MYYVAICLLTPSTIWNRSFRNPTSLQWRHNGTMASQITGVSIVCSTVSSSADQRKYRSSTALAFVRGIHRWPVNSPHKGPVTLWCFHLMMSSWVSPSVLPSCYMLVFVIMFSYFFYKKDLAWGWLRAPELIEYAYNCPKYRWNVASLMPCMINVIYHECQNNLLKMRALCCVISTHSE